MQQTRITDKGERDGTADLSLISGNPTVVLILGLGNTGEVSAHFVKTYFPLK